MVGWHNESRHGGPRRARKIHPLNCRPARNGTVGAVVDGVVTFMNPWIVTVLIAVLLVLGGALYIRLRWHRSPIAYRAMLAVSACFLLAGSLIGAWVLHLAAPRPAEIVTTGNERVDRRSGC